MNRTIWFAVIASLWAAQLQAQSTPTPAAKPAPTSAAAPAAKPAVAAPAAPAGTAAATPAAKPTAPGVPAGDDKSVEWQIDPGHSHIGFTVKHLGFSKVNGQFKKFTGVVRADPKTAKISALDASAETATIDTGIEKRDAHLKGDEFLNAEKFPQLKLKLKTIKFTGNKFTAKADVTLRDVTKEVPFKGELLGTHLVNFGQGPQQRAGYEASATISRKDFGLKYAAVTEGLSVVGDSVDLDLAAEIVYVPPATTTAAPTTPGTAPVAAAAKPAAAAPSAKPAAPAAPLATNKPAAAAPAK